MPHPFPPDYPRPVPRVATPKAVTDLGEVDWYQLPKWYDILHSAGTAAEVDGLEAIAARYTTCRYRGAPRWLEPACGTARYLSIAARRGCRVHGFDALPAMIDYARRRFARAHLDATLDVAAFSDFPIPTRPAHFAFCLINSIRHVRTDDELLAHLERMSASLVRGAVYVVGMNVSAPGLEMPSEDVWTGARGSCRVTQLVQYIPPDAGLDPSSDHVRTERVYSHLTITTPTRETHADTQYRLRTFSGAQWRRILDRSPFRLIAIVDERGATIGEPDDPRWTNDHSVGYALWLLALR